MPARIARSSVATGGPKRDRTKNRKRNLDAFALAAESTAEKPRRQHRLGELLDDGSKRKRPAAKEDDGDDEDEEEEAPTKRRKAAAKDDSDVEEGSDSSGNEWTLGELGDDDDDSEIDSDEAFGESDEEHFQGFTFRGSSSGKTKPSAKKKQLRPAKDDEEDGFDLDEAASEDEDEGDDFGDEGVDLATMLDDEDEDVPATKRAKDRDMGDESDSDEDDDVESESDSDLSNEDEDDDRADEERIARMRDRLEALDCGRQSTKPKSAPQQTTLSVDDLLADIDPALRKQFAAATKTRKASERPKTLSAPLPKRQQDKLNREVATKKAKEQLDRWRDTVIQNRRAEFLSFPLKDPEQPEPLGKDKFVQTAPQNELEQNIRRIMEESGMVPKPGQKEIQDEDVEMALMKGEELEEKKLPLEEVMRRRADLRRARELLFREEIKAKRIAKIKSKSYRRVHRRERERNAEREREEREMFGLGPDEDETELADRRRAEERMGIKHRDSKWAKSLRATNRTVWDDGARDSVNEQARRKEELRKRIEGREIDDDEGSDVSSDEGDDEFEQDEVGSTLRQLDRIQREDRGQEAKGLAGMKFMRAAEERRRAQNDEDVERLRKEMAIEDGDEVESNDEIEDQGLGRAIFGPQSKDKKLAQAVKRPELEEGESSEDDGEAQNVEIVTEKPQVAGKKALKKIGAPSGPLAKGSRPDPKAADDDDVAANPWLTGPIKESKKDRRRAREMADGQVLIDTSTPAKRDIEKPKAKSASRAQEASQDTTSAGNTDGWTKVAKKANNSNDEEASDSDPEPTNPLLTTHEAEQASYQTRAFAGDDVAATFTAEKAAAAASDDEKETSTHLPGWGSWTGAGLSKALRASNARARHNPLYKTKTPGIKPANRKDAKLENVIISEKSERKGKKYQADLLPQEFRKEGKGKELYERSLRLPVGPEWSTKEVFQRNTRPRVVVKAGVAIEAIEKPMV